MAPTLTVKWNESSTRYEHNFLNKTALKIVRDQIKERIQDSFIRILVVLQLMYDHRQI